MWKLNVVYLGIRPAINVGLSVSRVGSAAQTKSMKQVNFIQIFVFIVFFFSDFQTTSHKLRAESKCYV